MASHTTRSSPSEQAVVEATGRDRKRWFERLDKWGAVTRSHRDIAAWLMSDRNIGVNVGFTAKGAKKSQIALQHERLPNAKAAEEMKAFWRDHLHALKALLEP